MRKRKADIMNGPTRSYNANTDVAGRFQRCAQADLPEHRAKASPRIDARYGAGCTVWQEPWIERTWRRAHESLVWAREARPDLRRRKDAFAFIIAGGWYRDSAPSFETWDRYLRLYDKAQRPISQNVQ